MKVKVKTLCSESCSAVFYANRSNSSNRPRRNGFEWSAYCPQFFKSFFAEICLSEYFVFQRSLADHVGVITTADYTSSIGRSSSMTPITR